MVDIEKFVENGDQLVLLLEWFFFQIVFQLFSVHFKTKGLVLTEKYSFWLKIRILSSLNTLVV